MRLESEISNIVVGVDGSETSLAALRHAQFLAHALNAHVEAIGCWVYPRMYAHDIMTGIGGIDEYKKGAEKELLQAVTTVCGSEAPANLTVSLVEGDPRHALTKASEGAGLLVVGRRGHGRLAGMLIGSVSSYCIAHAKCPVLVTHVPHGNEED